MPEKRSVLIGPRAKLDRALEHLHALDADCQAFLESEPYDVYVEFEQDPGCHVLRLSVRENPSLRLGTIVGDVVHNVRSCLDQVVWLMACQTTPLEKLWKSGTRRQVYFPIVRHRNEFAGHSVMPFLTRDARAVLDGLQPYNRDQPEFHPLALLNTFWNTDKHRVVFSGYTGFDMRGVRIRPASLHVGALQETTIDWTLDSEAELQDGAEIGRVQIGGGLGPPEAHVDVTGQPAAEIFFGSAGLHFTVETLGTMVEFVSLSFVLFEQVLDT